MSHAVCGNAYNSVKITPSETYQLFLFYGYRTYPWLCMIVAKEKVSSVAIEKIGSKNINVEKYGDDSLIIKYGAAWGQIVITSPKSFSYERLNI